MWEVSKPLQASDKEHRRASGERREEDSGWMGEMYRMCSLVQEGGRIKSTELALIRKDTSLFMKGKGRNRRQGMEIFGMERG